MEVNIIASTLELFSAIESNPDMTDIASPWPLDLPENELILSRDALYASTFDAGHSRDEGDFCSNSEVIVDALTESSSAEAEPVYLTEADLTDLLALLPDDCIDGENCLIGHENFFSSQKLSETVTEIDLQESVTGIDLQESISLIALSQLSEFESILYIHPHFHNLERFIKGRVSTLPETNVSATEWNAVRGNIDSGEYVETSDLETLSNYVDSEALALIYPEADQLMREVVVTTVQLSSDQRYAEWMARIERDCNNALASITTFQKNLLEMAKNDTLINKENLCPHCANTVVKEKLEKQATGLVDTSNTGISNNRSNSGKSCRCCTKKKRNLIPKQSSDILRHWLIEHADYPYPDDEEKMELCLRANLTLKKLNQWFSNGRRRILRSLGLFMPDKWKQ